MTSLADFLSLGTTLVVLGLIVAAVMKVYQMGAHIEEMKEILKDIRRGLGGFAQPYPAQPDVASAGVSALAAAIPQPETAAPPVPAPAPAYPQPLSVGPGMNFSRPPTPEELVRAIHEQDFRGDDFPL